MSHTVQIDELTYNPNEDVIRAVISGELGGRHVDLLIRFPLRPAAATDASHLRSTALLQLQQILRSASNVTLAPRASSDIPRRPSCDQPDNTSAWDNEGGAGRAAADVIMLI